MYQQNISQQAYNQHQHVSLQDGDLANIVLCELKRIAREYATACQEASNTDIRQLFEQLLHQTLRDQEQLYQTLSQLNLYGQPSSAPQQELQKEMQHHQQQLGGLQSFMQQWHRGGVQAGSTQNAGAVQQQQAQHNQQQYLQQQQAQHNQQQYLQQQQAQHNQQQYSQQQHAQQQHGQLDPSTWNNRAMNSYSTQPFTQQQQHHSSALSEATRETGSEPINNHTSGTPFSQ